MRNKNAKMRIQSHECMRKCDSKMKRKKRCKREQVQKITEESKRRSLPSQ